MKALFKIWNIFVLKIMTATVWSLTVTATCPPTPQATKAATRLRQNLMCDYDTLSRPVKNSSTTVPVYLTLDVNHIDMAEHKENMYIEGLFRFMWNDQYLSWSPWEYENISYLKLDDGMIWVPDLTVNLLNMKGIEQLKPASCVASFTGTVFCLPKALIDAPCEQDMRHWPYDQHNCSFMISSYMYYEHEQNLTGDRVITENLQNSRTWELRSYNLVRHRQSFARDPTMYYPYLEFSFMVRRHSMFYASATVLPACVMLTLVMVSFCLGPRCAIRIQICGFIILGCSTYLSYLIYLIPSNGDSVPVIVTLFRDCMALSGFAIVIAAIVKCLNESQSRPPTFLLSVTDWLDLSILSRLLLMRGASTVPEDEATIVESVNSKPSLWAPCITLLDRLAFLVAFLVIMVLLMGYLP